jgi:hypothetical protein
VGYVIQTARNDVEGSGTPSFRPESLATVRVGAARVRRVVVATSIVPPVPFVRFVSTRSQ